MKSIFKISIRQVKAARALLAWSQEDLAKAAAVSIPTVRRLEAKDGPLGGRSETIGKLTEALEGAGIEFITERGVSLRGTNDFCPPQSGIMEESLTGPQIRAARALIGWTADQLSRKSTVSVRTIRRAELANGRPSMTTPNELALRHALESAGVEFINENGGGPGVRLRKRLKKD